MAMQILRENKTEMTEMWGRISELETAKFRQMNDNNYLEKKASALQNALDMSKAENTVLCAQAAKQTTLIDILNTRIDGKEKVVYVLIGKVTKLTTHCCKTHGVGPKLYFIFVQQEIETKDSVLSELKQLLEQHKEELAVSTKEGKFMHNQIGQQAEVRQR